MEINNMPDPDQCSNCAKWECQRCGKCCQDRGDMTDSESPVVGDCPHLKFDDNGLASCGCYEFRPDVCSEYPNHAAYNFKCDNPKAIIVNSEKKE